MKLRILNFLPVALAGLFFGGTASAQTTTSAEPMRTWSIGVNAGTLSGISPLGGQNDFSNWKNGGHCISSINNNI